RPQLLERDPVLGTHSGRGGTEGSIALGMVQLSQPILDVPGTSVPTAATPWDKRWADYPRGDKLSQGVQSVSDLPGCKAPFAEVSRVVSLSRGISHFLDLPKSQRGYVMPFQKTSPTRTADLCDLAEDWGKVIARRA